MSGKPGIFSRILSRVITLALLAIFTLIIIQPLSIYQALNFKIGYYDSSAKNSDGGEIMASVGVMF